MAAVVHHGGAGTTTAAARAGAPQAVVPQGGDQVYWGGRVVALGVGATHDGLAPSAASLSAALRTALAPRTRLRATAMAAGFVQSGGGGAESHREAESHDRPPHPRREDDERRCQVSEGHGGARRRPPDVGRVRREFLLSGVLGHLFLPWEIAIRRHPSVPARTRGVQPVASCSFRLRTR
ncbi:MAG TPA: nucleotide disphospho-sugar-binding domain-containing protein [Actinoplanes sp.]|nr:nucleotide disphospho-sugar-binding domain-containing protein [Actinoplanes sp.]